MSSIYREIEQMSFDIGLSQALGAKSKDSPENKAERKADKKAAQAKMDARKRLVPIQDPDAGKASQRRKAAMKKGSGRGSTILSQNREKLG